MNLLSLSIGIIAAATLLSCAEAPQELPDQPDIDELPHWFQEPNRNILLLIADDMGVDQVGVYDEGVDPPSTPIIDELANAGVFFRNAWSNPICSPTRATLFTGRDASNVNIGSPIGRTDSGLECSERTLPELLNSQGYASGLFGKWHLGSSTSTCTIPSVPLSHGFDRFFGAFEGHLDDYYSWDKLEFSRTASGGWSPIVTSSTTYATTENVDDALEWIGEKEAASTPWMATIAFNAPHEVGTGTPHADFQLPPAYRSIGIDTSDVKARYKASIEYMDMSIGRLLDELRESWVLARTIVIFIGDNGTPEDVADTFAGSKSKGTLFEGGINVPMIIADGYVLNLGSPAPPGWNVRIASPNRELDVDSAGDKILVHTMDIFETAIEIAGGTSTGRDSQSVLPYLVDSEPTAVRDYVFTEQFQRRRSDWAIRDNDYKLKVIDPNTSVGGNEVYTCFDLRADPEEESDIYTSGGIISVAALARCDSLKTAYTP